MAGFDLTSMLAGLGGGAGQGMGGINPQMLQQMLTAQGMGGMTPGMDPRMLQQMLMAQGQGQGFGLGQQLPGLAQAQGAGGGLPGDGTLASMLGGMGGQDADPSMAAMLARFGPALLQQGGQQQMPTPGALPVAGASPGAGGGPQGLRGYMAQGGGIAPRRIVQR